jgi:autoinducer 2-degrading protein
MAITLERYRRLRCRGEADHALMPVVMVVHWVAKAGEEQAIVDILRTMVRETKKERGSVLYEANQSIEDPRRFLIYEVYEDPAAQTAHEATEHFRRYVLEQALPRLESRVRTFFKPV